VRASLKNEWLDQAERVMWQSLDLSKSKPGHAFRAATYVLNSKGKDRGWNPVQQEAESDNTLALKVNYPNAERNPIEVFPESVPTIDN